MEKAWSRLILLFSTNKALADEFWWQTTVDDPDRILERFLIGCKHDNDKAVDALVKFLEWRKSFRVRELIYSGEANGIIPKHLWESGKGIFWGYDKDGFLVVYLHPRKHNMHLQGREETMRHIVYQTELGRRLFKKNKDKVTVVVDMKETGLNAMDVSCAFFVLDCLQAFYPESLNKVLIINANFVFYYLLAAVQPILNRAVDAKVLQLSTPIELLQFIDAEYLMTEYGGLSEYQYKYIEPNSPSNNPLMDQELEHLTKQADRLREQFNATQNSILKASIKQVYQKMDQLIYPGDLYTRMGIEIGPGVIDWKLNVITKQDKHL